MPNISQTNKKKIIETKNSNLNKNQKISLLSHFKKIKSSEFRVKKLEELIKGYNLVFELDPTQLISILSLFHTLNRGIVLKTLIRFFVNPELTALKNLELEAAELQAFLFMFTKADRFEALKLLKNNFDIKTHLTESDIKKLEACLASDPAFNNLLSFDKKKFWDSFFVKHKKESNTHLIQHQMVTSRFTKSKNPRSTKPSYLSNTSPKRFSQNKLSEPLSLETVKCKQLRCRFDFFKNYVKAHKNPIFFKNVEELSNFIKIFPAHDAVEFLNLSYIKAQIKSLQQQKAYLSMEAYNDLLNFLPNYFDKKLLRPISPSTKPKLLQQGIFKEKSNIELEFSRMLPDIIIPSCKVIRTK